MTSIANLTSDSEAITIRVKGHKLDLTYRPGRVSMAEDAIRERMVEEGDSLAMAKSFCRLVTKWGATGPVIAEEIVEPDDDGEIVFGDDEPVRREIKTVEREVVADGAPVPLDPEILQHIGYPTLVAITQAIVKHAMPNPTQTGRTNRARRR